VDLAYDLERRGMSCAHGYVPTDGAEGIFSVDASNLTFGRGALRELGPLAAGLGCRRVAVFTDARVSRLEPFEHALASLTAAGIDAAVYDEVLIEPTDASFLAAARFATDARVDGYVSLGGGSVIDTCKAASLLATHPADLLTYVNKPVGAGASVPGPLPPHIACPTTSGTGSELTGIAVCDLLDRGFKTGIASRRLRPALAVVDPIVTRSLPAGVVAASGFDVLCHALESFTARPFTLRSAPASPAERPMSQGRNPWSDLGSLEALRLCGRFLERAVRDASDDEAREGMIWAATLAGLAFGNAGVHLPHAMAYAVAGIAFQRSHRPLPEGAGRFTMAGYPPDQPLVPHGISVVTSAPAAFRFTASACPGRHLEAAAALGEDIGGATPEDAGAIVARCLERLMHATAVPVDLRELGYDVADTPALVSGTIVQRRLLDNAPRAIDESDLDGVFRDAIAPRESRGRVQ
jgi:alcohol dehydrogenase class IV